MSKGRTGRERRRTGATEWPRFNDFGEGGPAPPPTSEAAIAQSMVAPPSR